ncbi:hypothetical protein PMZ80_000973 [Knufia obscura]|uniref:Tafazzin n=1 Tax=Knufia obscura TaxID=1635080 RepID=A0ABR0S1S8_9EURO|nr:hypothetical protein PMZ80_000973 [Knufia obscura]
MPKKRQNPAFLTKPATSAPSSYKSNVPSGSHGVPAVSTRSVNELIRESRRSKGKDRVDIAATSSIHPTLRAVLDMPAPSPPTRTHLRGPARLRRIPGPPPPQSWLADSQHAPESSRSTFQQLRWLRARIQQQSSTLPGGTMPKQNSLEHAVLKAMAINWSWHAEYDNTYLATLPVGTRTTLLSYLAVYNEAHWPNPFPLLFPIDCEQDELDSVTRLDLANSIGAWATTVKKVEKELVVTKEVAKNIGVHQTALKTTEDVPESWDEEPEAGLFDDSTISVAEIASNQITHPSIPKAITISSRFTNLKHLSLAVNLASSAAPPSWATLVSLSAHLSQLKSLSLAHWPTPTYTPNAAKGRVQVVNTAGPSLPNQVFGGTDLYTAFDSNWREAAGILRSLSRNLYCLTWLDLSGCGPWLTSLTWADEDGDMVSADWNGAWRNIDAIILGVGWLPGRPPSLEDELSSTTRSTSSIDSTRAIEQLYGGSESIQASLAHLSELRLSNSGGPNRSQTSTQSPPEQPWNVERERARQYFLKDVQRYISQRKTAKKVARDIKAIRKLANGRYIDFEFGEELGPGYTDID